MVPNRGASWAKCYWVKKYELWCGSAGTDRGESCLWLVVRHLLDQWLTGELLRAAGEVLGRVSGALCYNRWSCCRCWMHHGGRARRVVLVWPLLGHVGYWRGIHEEAEEKRFKFYIQTLHWSMMKKLETEKLMFFCCCCFFWKWKVIYHIDLNIRLPPPFTNSCSWTLEKHLKY